MFSLKSTDDYVRKQSKTVHLAKTSLYTTPLMTVV